MLHISTELDAIEVQTAET